VSGKCQRPRNRRVRVAMPKNVAGRSMLSGHGRLTRTRCRTPLTARVWTLEPPCE
jgi:hypothetical protein